MLNSETGFSVRKRSWKARPRPLGLRYGQDNVIPKQSSGTRIKANPARTEESPAVCGMRGAVYNLLNLSV